jgi:putative transposase
LIFLDAKTASQAYDEGSIPFTRSNPISRSREIQRFLSRSFGHHLARRHVERNPFRNTFNVQRHLISRRTLRLFRAEEMQEWRAVTTAA